MTNKELVGQRGNVPLSPAVKAGHTLYVSGQVPTGADGTIPQGIEAQTKAVLDKIAGLVKQAGGSMDDVVKTTVFLKRVEDFAAMNGIYGKYFPGIAPARSTIRCELMIDILVEIEAIAQIG